MTLREKKYMLRSLNNVKKKQKLRTFEELSVETVNITWSIRMLESRVINSEMGGAKINKRKTLILMALWRKRISMIAHADDVVLLTMEGENSFRLPTLER